MSTPLEVASQPLALLDGLPAGIALEAWIKKLDPHDPRRGEALVRLAELLRPIDPMRAYTIAEEAAAANADPLRVAAVRCAALLEQNQPVPAEPWMVDLPLGPARDLLEARHLLLTGRVAEGRSALDLLVETPGVPPEIAAEALSFRARARPERGVEALLADFARLEQLCITHRWTLTGIWLGLITGVIRSQGWERFAVMVTRFDLVVLLDETLRDVDIPDTLGKVPAWVHAAAVKHRTEPKKLAETLILLGALLWKSGAEDDAYRTVVFGAAIARRLSGATAADDLDAFVGVLRRHAGEAKWATLAERLVEA